MRKALYPLIVAVLTLNLTSCVSTRQVIESPSIVIKHIENNSDKNSNFVKSNEWMVNTFNNAKSVIQFTDKEAGIVKGKYIMKEGYKSNSMYSYSEPDKIAIITIRVKDNACRIEIDPPSGMYYSEIVFGTEIGFTPEMFNKSAETLVVDFEKHMKRKSGNDIWQEIEE